MNNDLLRVEAQAEAHNKLLAVVSHELRTRWRRFWPQLFAAARSFVVRHWTAGRRCRDLMRQLRARGIPGIAISGFDSAKDREEYKEAGFAEALVKPVDIEE